MTETIAFLAAVLAVVGFAVNRASRWAGRRGWVYNKHNPRPPGAGIPLLFDQIFEPSIVHVMDEQTSEITRRDQAETGEKHDPEDQSQRETDRS